MAPQGSLAVPPAVESAPQIQHPVNTSHKPFVPLALLIFLGLCLAYTFSYVLYRAIMSRRRESEEDVPESADRGVSQFMNGARLSLNFGQSHKPTISSLSNILEEKHPSHPSLPEIAVTSPAESSSTPLILLTPSLTIHPDQETSQVHLQEQGSAAGDEASNLAVPVPAQTQPPFLQRVAANVKLLSRDRAEAITQDPKLAPVQGPLRPLSMISSPTRKKRATLFGLGLRPGRAQSGEPDTDTGPR